MAFEFCTVPAGTHIEQLDNGLLVFCPPNEPPFTLMIDGSSWPPTVTKTTVAPECETTITIGTAQKP